MKKLIITHNTYLKSKPIQSQDLIDKYGNPNNDYIYSINGGTELELKFSTFDDGSGHYYVGLAKPLPGCNYLNWYVYQEHATVVTELTSGSSQEVKLAVPYKSQLDNEYRPYGTCNLTSAAMVYMFYGVKETPNQQLEDEMFVYCENHGLDRHYGEDIAKVIEFFGKPFGLKDNFTYTTNWDAVIKQLMAGHPGIIHGNFTQSGHIIVVTGFSESKKCFYVNDPYGECLGYAQYDTRVRGEQLKYPFEMMDELCGTDGGIWYHFITN